MRAGAVFLLCPQLLGGIHAGPPGLIMAAGEQGPGLVSRDLSVACCKLPGQG